MIESNVGVETDGETRQGAIFAEHAVAEREERNDGVGGRAAVAGGEVEGGQWRGLRFGGDIGFFYHSVEVLEVLAGSRAFDAEELFERGGFKRVICRSFKFENDRFGWFHMIAHEHGAMIADFPVHELPGQREAGDGIAGNAELFHAQEDIL